MPRIIKRPEPKNIQWQERDGVIVWAAYRHRFVSFDDIQLLTGWSGRRTQNQRLALLWGNGYIDRPNLNPEKPHVYDFTDEYPAFIALGSKGAEWLRTVHGVYFQRKINWEKENAQLKRTDFVPHTLGVTHCMVRAECDFRGADGLRLVQKYELWRNSPQHNPNVKNPFALPTTLTPHDGEPVHRNTVPDELFAIHDSRDAETVRGLNFLEYDRNTEGYFRRSLHQSSPYQKFLGYSDAYKRKLAKRFGYKKFRVLFVVEERFDRPAADRVAGLIDLYNNHARDFSLPAGGLLFTTRSQLDTAGLLAPIWVDVNGRSVSLIREM